MSEAPEASAAGDEGIVDPARGVSRRPVRRTLEVVLLGAILGGLVLVGGRWAWQEYGFVGREQRIVLSWECANHIEWEDESRGTRWRVPQGTRRPTPTSSSAHGGHRSLSTANGTIRFDGRDAATFRSDGGGETPMVRVSGDQFFEMSCQIG